MTEDDLLNQFRDLEVALYQPDVRSNAGRFDVLLHDALVEFGRSGRDYRKADVLRELPSEQPTETVGSQSRSCTSSGHRLY